MAIYKMKIECQNCVNNFAVTKDGKRNEAKLL